MKLFKYILLSSVLTAVLTVSGFAQSTGSISGSVTDTLGAVVVGATVTLVSPKGTQKMAITNARGEFNVAALEPGNYTVKAIAPKFALYQNTEVAVTAGAKSELIVVLTVSGVEENVDVSNNETVSNEAGNNADATIIKGKDLDALPDDPDELQAALLALAGPSAGPNGGQIYIDGFTGGQMPSKESIREIRINQNPFSAEFDRLGFGRIEILTRPGSEKWRGSLNSNFNDESLNSRNPFATNRAPTQLRAFGGNISGPITKGKSSFFLDINNRNVENNTIINAQIIDSAYNIVGYRRDVTVPNKRFSIGPRVDFAINDKNTLVARYNYSWSSNDNQGIGDTSLQSRAFTTRSTEHEIRLTETMIINATTVNETRFEYSKNSRDQKGDNTIPTISVPSSFTGGGSQIGLSFNHNRTFELNNFTATTFGKNNQHSIKFGGRLRNVSVADRSENNFGGTFSFPGFFGADAYDLNGDGVVSSIEQYRAKVLSAVGPRYNPTQFSLTTGTPLETVSQTEVGFFATDDWRISPALLLSFGLRYENQSNISSNMNFAPRFGFAWSPGAGGAKAPKTVFRGGAGIFYDRFSENFTLQAARFDGVSQLNLLVSANDTDPTRRAAAVALLAQPVFTLTGVTNVPTAAQILAVLPSSSTVRQVASDLQAPYTMQVALGIERQLPARTRLTFYYISSRSLHQLRTRNINAPICPLQVNCLSAPRPQPTRGNISQFDSSGTINQNRLNISVSTSIGTKVTLSANYGLGFAKGDSDGAGSSPAYAYDFTGEYGRTSFDIRHSFSLFGNISLPWGVSISPIISAGVGRPFNIIRGVDANGDGVFSERPTYGDLRNRCTELRLTASFCDIGSNDLTSILPRNYGEGPGNFSVSLRFSKTIGFGKSAAATAGTGGEAGRGPGGAGAVMVAGPGGGGPGGPGGGPGGGGGRGPGGGGMGGMFGGGGGDARKPYNLNFGIFVTNLFNTVNLGNPVGNLSSSRFGQSTSTGGGFGGGGFGGFGGGGGAANRRIELSMRFNW